MPNKYPGQPGKSSLMAIVALIVLSMNIQDCLTPPVSAQATADKPFSDEAVKHYNKGNELAGDNFLNQALPEYRAAIAADERMEPAWSNLGAVYARQKNYSKAVEAYQIC